MHTVKAGAAAQGCRPHVALTVATNAIGAAWAHLNEHPAVHRSSPIHLEHPDVTDINHIKPRLVWGEADAVRSIHLSDHGNSLPGGSIDPEDVTRNFLDRLITFIVALDTPARISEPHRSVGVHGNIVRSVQRLSVVAVHQDRNGAVVFGSSDASGQVFAGHQSPLPVARVTVAVIRRLSKNCHL